MAGNLNESWNDLCRLCATKISVLMGINIFEDNARQLNHKINTCLPIQILETDNFPKMICTECNHKVELCFAFREKALQTQSLLISLMEKQDCPTTNSSIPDNPPVPKNTVVKSEVILDTNDSDITSQELDPIGTNADSMLQFIYQDLNVTESQIRLQNFDSTNSEDHLMSGQFEEVLIQEYQPKCSEQPQSPEITIKIENKGKPETDETSGEYLNNGAANTNFVYMNYKTLQTLLKGPKTVNSQTSSKVEIISNYKHNANDKKENNLLKVNSKRTFDDSDGVDKNVKKSKQGEPKTCRTCGKSFKTNYRLSEHTRKHTGERPYKCSTCDKAFRNKPGLRRHEAKHTGKYDFSCLKCGKGFPYKSELKLHENIHNDLELKSNVCTICGKTFARKQSLSVHTDRHNGKKPFVCEVCGRGFVTKGLYKAHQSVRNCVVNRQFPCTICKKKFVSKSYLATHILIHTGEKPFICKVCGKGFLKDLNLRIHSAVHTSEKSYMCEICNKTFTGKNAYKCHQKLHTSERPYRCDICEKTFTKLSILQIHKRIHTGDRPYECKVCGNAFSSRCKMILHNKKHVT